MKGRSWLIWLSDICTVLFGVGQVWQITRYPAKQAISWYLSFFLFLLFALLISMREVRTEPTPQALERRWAYRLWFVVASIDLVYALFMKSGTGAEVWTRGDTSNLILYGSVFAIFALIAGLRRMDFTDSIVRGSSR